MSTQATGGPARTDESRPPENPTSIKARLVTGWVLVGVPLAYGVYQTLLRVAKLFTE